METEKKFKEVAVLDVCPPDYFSGYCYAVLAVPLYHGITNKQVSDNIKQAVNNDYDYLSCDYSDDNITLFEKFADKLTENENAFDIEQCECDDNDDCECATYLYLGLCNPVINSGIMFLNP